MIDVSFLAKTPKVLPDIHSLKPQINHHPNPCVGVRFSFSFFRSCFPASLSVCTSQQETSPSGRSAPMTGQIFGCCGICCPRAKMDGGLGLGAK